MEDKDSTNVPFFIHEGAMARAERSNRRMLIALVVMAAALVVCIGALVVNNRMWMNYTQAIESQVEVNK
mgnify:CR=1 FL=1